MPGCSFKPMNKAKPFSSTFHVRASACHIPEVLLPTTCKFRSESGVFTYQSKNRALILDVQKSATLSKLFVTWVLCWCRCRTLLDGHGYSQFAHGPTLIWTAGDQSVRFDFFLGFEFREATSWKARSVLANQIFNCGYLAAMTTGMNVHSIDQSVLNWCNMQAIRKKKKWRKGKMERKDGDDRSVVSLCSQSVSVMLLSTKHSS